MLKPGADTAYCRQLAQLHQLNDLAGVDVFTMPTKVASEGKEKLSGRFSSNLAKV